MMPWLLVNTTLGLLALLFLATNRDVPHRLRFHVCVLALSSWLLPWHLLAALVPTATLLPTVSAVLELRAVLPGNIETDIPKLEPASSFVGVASPQVLAFAFVLGACLFLRTVLQHLLLLRSLAASAKECVSAGINIPDNNEVAQSLPIYPQKLVPGALTTGVFRPVIWVHESLLQSESLPAVLLHERTHVHQHDNAWLCVITVVEKLLWWNPLVLHLAARARRLMELSCDASCQNESHTYRSKLSRLILDLSRESATNPGSQGALHAGMFKDAKFNVERVRQLERRTEMKVRNYLSAGMLAVASIAVIGASSVLSQDTAPIPQASNESVSDATQDDKEARIARDRAETEVKLTAMERSRGPTQTRDELLERRIVAGLEIYLGRVEAMWKEMNQSNAMLEARVRELEMQLAQNQ